MAKVKSKNINDFNKEELEKLAAEGQLVDVRSKIETFFGKIKGSIHHPVNRIQTFEEPKSKTYYVYCQSGQRSLMACQTLANKGYKVVNLTGGFGSFKNK